MVKWHDNHNLGHCRSVEQPFVLHTLFHFSRVNFCWEVFVHCPGFIQDFVGEQIRVGRIPGEQHGKGRRCL